MLSLCSAFPSFFKDFLGWSDLRQSIPFAVQLGLNRASASARGPAPPSSGRKKIVSPRCYRPRQPFSTSTTRNRDGRTLKAFFATLLFLVVDRFIWKKCSLEKLDITRPKTIDTLIHSIRNLSGQYLKIHVVETLHLLVSKGFLPILLNKQFCFPSCTKGVHWIILEFQNSKFRWIDPFLFYLHFKWKTKRRHIHWKTWCRRRSKK